MGMDIGGGFGAGGAVQGLQELLKQRFLQAQQNQQANQFQQTLAEQNRKNVADEGLRQQAIQEQAAWRQMQADELKRNHEDVANIRRGAEADALGNAIPPNTFIPQNDPAVGILQTGGRGSLLTAQPERPAVDVGPLLPGDTGAARPAGYLKTSSQKQIEQAAADKDKQDALGRAAAHETEIERHDRAMENKPQSAATVTIQTVDENGNPVTKVLPKSEAVGQTFAKGPNATVANRLASAKAVVQTGNDVIQKLKDPQFAQMVGPALGRYNTVRDFLGNPPPEFAGLAGQIESYALASMGVHGMRSAQGAEAIKKILDARHTPESLAAAIQGLNNFSQHLIDNETQKSGDGTGTTKATKPSAEELIKKYGG